MRSRLQVSPERYHQVALAALALLVLIVFSGAAVRLTGSGLGCPEWPTCSERGIYQETGIHAVIEFTNRLFTFIITAAALAAAILAWFRVPPRGDLKLLGALLPLGVFAQAVLGGLSVIYDLKPGFVMGHYVLSLIVLIPAWALWWRSAPDWERRSDEAGEPDRAVLWTTRALAPLGLLMMVAGTAATAAGPHAGGRGTGDLVQRLYVKEGDTLDWAVNNHTMIGAVLGLAALIAIGVAWYRGAGRGTLTSLASVVVLLGVQGIIGAVQYQAQLPAELVWVHVCLATVTWVALLWAWSAAGSPAGEPATEQAGRPARTPASAA